MDRGEEAKDGRLLGSRSDEDQNGDTKMRTVTYVLVAIIRNNAYYFVDMELYMERWAHELFYVIASQDTNTQQRLDL